MVLEISVNAYENRALQLEQENASLVDRWMQKMAQEAETMNDANEFLKSVGKYQ